MKNHHVIFNHTHIKTFSSRASGDIHSTQFPEKNRGIFCLNAPSFFSRLILISSSDTGALSLTAQPPTRPV